MRNARVLMHAEGLLEVNLRDNQLTGTLPVQLAALPLLVSRLYTAHHPARLCCLAPSQKRYNSMLRLTVAAVSNLTCTMMLVCIRQMTAHKQSRALTAGQLA